MATDAKRYPDYPNHVIKNFETALQALKEHNAVYVVFRTGNVCIQNGIGTANTYWPNKREQAAIKRAVKLVPTVEAAHQLRHSRCWYDIEYVAADHPDASR